MTLLEIEVRELAAGEVDRIEADEPAGQGFVRAMWRLQSTGDSVLLVAWNGTEPLGLGQLDLRTSPIELKNLNVRAGFRGRGVGSALVEAAEAWARERAYAQICLGVAVDNPDARRLYDRLGYVGTGRLSTVTYDYVDVDGRSRTATETDELLLKTLAP